MKKLLLAASASAWMVLNAAAIPTLQLDASPATYDASSSTTISSTPNFTLYAMLNSLTPTAGTTYDIVAAITPEQTTPANLGSFVFNGSTVNATSDLTFNNGGNPGLPPHGVYPTYYKEFAFTWNTANTFNNYDVSLVGGTHTGPTGTTPGNALYMSFNVDVAGLDAGYTLWFDLIQLDANGKVIANEPFSHAAQGGTGGSSVPDGGSTIMLLGMAMLGLGWAKRKISA